MDFDIFANCEVAELLQASLLNESPTSVMVAPCAVRPDRDEEDEDDDWDDDEDEDDDDWDDEVDDN